jgi:hypothetical protein
MPYDELGNYIPDDTLTLDEMRYKLAHSGQKNPPHGYEYAKPGRMPLRANGSDVPMLPEEVAQTLVPIPPPEPKKPYSTATNFPQVVADRLGISAIPQAIMAMGAGFGSEVAKGTGNKELSEAMRYEPTSRITNDVLAGLEQAPKTITGSHMGFGPMPETWVTGLGTVSPNDIRVLAKQNIERARELKAIPEDFRNAQYGVRRESALGGDTYGAALQRAADDLADFQARNQARRSEYATPMSGSVQVFGNLMPENAMYAVRPNKSGSQVIREVPTPLNPAYSVTGESRLSEDLTDIVDRQEPRTQDDKSYQHFNQFTNFVPGEFNKSAQTMFHDFIQPVLAQEFPGTPTADHSRAIHAKYGNNANEWYKKQLEAFALTPEAKTHNEQAFKVAMSDPDIPDPFEFLKDVLIIPPSAHFASKKASDAWVMNNLQNYLVEHLGTPGDPALKVVAETGRAGLDPSKLEQIVGNQRLADEARDLRTRAGMPAEGTYERELNKYFDLLPQQNTVIQMLQDKENELISANPGVRPQDIPGWKEARKEVVQATKRKDETAAKLENLRVAQALENYNDTQVKIANEEDFTTNLEPYFKERFPMLPTNKDIAFQMRVPAQFRELAKDTQNRLAVSGASGIKNIVKAEDIASYSVPKAVQVRAEMMMQREKMTEKTAKANEQRLMEHTKSRMDSMPQDGVFGPATVGRISKDLGINQIKSDLSDITYWMDHCIGRGGSPNKSTPSPFAIMMGKGNVSTQGKRRQYQPSVLSHLGNRVPPGSSGAVTSYMNDVESGSSQIIDFRDTATGIPYATLNLKPSNNDKTKFRIGEFYGYQDGKVQGPMVPNRGREYKPEEVQPYRQAVADWANSQAQNLVPTSGDYLIDHADVYDLEYSDHRNSLARQLGVNVKEAKEMAYTMGKRFVTGDEAKVIWKASKEVTKESVESLRAARDELSDQIREGEDPDSTISPTELDDLRNQLADLDSRIAAMENRPPIGARAVTQTVQLMPDWNRMVNEIREDTRTQLDTNDAAAMANAIEETQNLFTFSQQPHEFVADLERRADQFENNNENREEVARAIRNVAMGYDSQIINDPVPAARTTPQAVNFLANDIVAPNAAFRDQTTANIVNAIEDQLLPSFQRFNPVIPGDRQELERQLSFFQNSPLDQDLGTRLESYIQGNPTQENRIRESIADFMIDQIQQHLGNRPQAPAAQVPVMRVNEPYVTVRNALQHLINASDVEAMQGIADNIMTNQNGPYAQLDDTQRNRLRRQLNDEIDRIRLNREPMPLEGIIAMDMNRIRDNYDQEVYNTVDGVLTSINDNYDVGQDPALFIERIRRQADMNRVHGDVTMEEIYNNLATQLTSTLRENNAIYDARRRAGNVVDEEDEGPLVLDDDQIDDIASDYINNLDDSSLANVLQEAQDMRNGMIDLPEFRELTNNQRVDAQNEIAMRMEMHVDMMRDTDDMENMDEWEPEEPQRLPAPEAQNTTVLFGGQQYNNPLEAYLGILDANNQFAGQEGLDTLRALPQLLRRQNLRQDFGIANLSEARINDVIHDFEELYASRLRNAAEAENRRLTPPEPEGHKRGGYIKKKMMKNGGEYNLPDLGNDEEEPKYTKPFNPPAIPYAYPGIKGAKINRAIPLDRNSAITMSADVSRRQDQGGTNYNVNEFGGGYHHKVGPGMLGISGSHRPGTHENRVNLMYAIPMNEGGKVEPSSQSSSIDEALQQPGLKHKFTSEDILKNYGDSVFESYDKSKARKNLEPIVLKEIMSPTDSYDDGQHLMNRKSVPLGKADSPAAPTGQSFEDFQRQHMHRLRPEEVSRRGNTGIKNGGAVDIDQMRYELTRKQ